MRIVHVIDYFQPHLGYQEFYLAREQQRMGHQVEVITSDRYYPFPHYLEARGSSNQGRFVGCGTRVEQGLTVHRLPGLLEYTKSAVIVLKGVGRAIRALAPQVVHCHDVFGITPFLVSRAKDGASFALVYDNHAADFNTNFRDSWLKRAYHAFFTLVMSRSIVSRGDAFFGVTEAERDFLSRELGLPLSRIGVIRLGVDSSLFRFDPAQRKETRAALGLGAEELLLLHVGRLNPAKDLEVLIASLAELKDVFPRMRALLLGSGSQAFVAGLRAQAASAGVADRVFFVPSQHQQELYKYYSAADVGVWPGGPSIAILEGMACGLPVVIWDCYGTSYYLSQGGGLSFPRGDSVALARAIARLASDASFRSATGAAAKQMVAENLTWSVIAGQTLKLYRSLLGGGAS